MKPKILLSLFAAALILSGCSKDAQPDGNGRLRINFLTDVTIEEVTTRSMELNAPSPDEFSLRVVKSDNSYDETWESVADYPGEGMYMEAGTYTATALWGNIDEEGFGCQAFGVTKSFNVIPNTTVAVELEAKLVNMGVSVDYTKEFKGYFPTHNAVIMRGANEIVDFAADPSGVAFIKPESFKLVVDYTHQNPDKTGTFEFDVAGNLAAATHLRINVDVNQGNVGEAVIVVTFNDEVETIPVPIEVGDE